MNSLRRMLGSNVRQYGMVLALAAIVLFFQFQTNGVLLKPLNVSNLLTQNSYILILAIGMVMVIISRHIDLSVGSVAAFTGAMAAIMMTRWDLPWFVAVVLFPTPPFPCKTKWTVAGAAATGVVSRRPVSPLTIAAFISE